MCASPLKGSHDNSIRQTGPSCAPRQLMVAPPADRPGPGTRAPHLRRTFTSEEAPPRAGHHVVETDAVVPSALEYAGDLAANCSPASMRSIKAQVRAAWEQPLLTAIAEGEELERQALASADFRRGRDELRRTPPTVVPGAAPDQQLKGRRPQSPAVKTRRRSKSDSPGLELVRYLHLTELPRRDAVPVRNAEDARQSDEAQLGVAELHHLSGVPALTRMQLHADETLSPSGSTKWTSRSLKRSSAPSSVTSGPRCRARSPIWRREQRFGRGDVDPTMSSTKCCARLGNLRLSEVVQNHSSSDERVELEQDAHVERWSWTIS